MPQKVLLFHCHTLGDWEITARLLMKYIEQRLLHVDDGTETEGTFSILHSIDTLIKILGTVHTLKTLDQTTSDAKVRPILIRSFSSLS